MHAAVPSFVGFAQNSLEQGGRLVLFDAASPLVPAAEGSPRIRLCKNRVRSGLSAGGESHKRTRLRKSGFESDSGTSKRVTLCRSRRFGARYERRSLLVTANQPFGDWVEQAGFEP
jgi:hypothetical protein